MALLCLDIGNTHILGGVFQEGILVARFRCATHLMGTADQLGMFLINVLAVNQLERESIKAVSICSVVPSGDYTIRHTFALYFKCELFFLKVGVKTGLNIRVKQPNEVGADRIANAIGAIQAIPNEHLIIIDLGTATTVCAVSAKKDYLGGAILPGLRLGMEALKTSTAKLMSVDIEVPESYVGRTTRESIQSGLYYGHLGALKEIVAGLHQEAFNLEPMRVIGTGGFSQLYRETALFDLILPDLVLQGLQRAYELSKLA